MGEVTRRFVGATHHPELCYQEAGLPLPTDAIRQRVKWMSWNSMPDRMCAVELTVMIGLFAPFDHTTSESVV